MSLKKGTPGLTYVGFFNCGRVELDFVLGQPQSVI